MFNRHILFYDPVYNVLINKHGEIIFNVYDYVSPNQYMLFKKNKRCKCVFNKGRKIELVWPERDGDLVGDLLIQALQEM